MTRIILLLMILYNNYAFCSNSKTLNIFIWYNSIPSYLIAQFEQETGIKVNVDFYDSNNVLETKLISGNTGYDIVSPTAWPFVARQVPIGIYTKLSKHKLKNYKNIDNEILKKINTADPNNDYFVPYFWGLVAIGYNYDKLQSIIAPSDLNSWSLLYDAELVKNTSFFKRALLDDSVDVLLSCYIYNNINLFNHSKVALQTISNNLKKIRPYIKKFSNSATPQQLANGELDIVMHWSEFLLKAKKSFSSLPNRPNIKIVLPKEGTLMWVDGFAIPKDAKNIDNAYKFIDFLLRVKSSAYITNNTGTATAIIKNRELINKEIRENKVIFPDKQYMNKVFLPEIKSLHFQRKLSRHFSAIITHK